MKSRKQKWAEESGWCHVSAFHTSSATEQNWCRLQVFSSCRLLKDNGVKVRESSLVLSINTGTQASSTFS